MSLEALALGVLLLFGSLQLFVSSSTTVCSDDGAVRLLVGNETDSINGRLEVCLNGEWGTVCNDDWDMNDAIVVCRQLGIAEEELDDIVGFKSFGAGPSNQSIHFTLTNCIGNESRLIECPRNVTTDDCEKQDDVGLVCERSDEATTVDQEQTSVNESVVTEAETESTETTMTDIVSTTQELTTTVEESTISTTDGFTTIVAMTTNEGGLGNECTVTTSGEVRLVGGVHDGVLEGRLEVCLIGEWGTVCNDGWDMDDARVVCRQLGIAEEELDNIETGLSFGGGPSNQQTHFEAPTCDGSESRLIDCDNLPGHDCEKPEDVGIICQRSEDCIDGEVRLVDGDVPTEGRVEFCRGGQWGTVCDNDNTWDNDDVAVVCNQLGNFTLEPRVLTPVPAVDNLNTPIMMYDVECIGREDGLSDCQRRTTVEYCSHSDDVGANCTREFECDDNDVRLVGSSVENEGIVEFCRNGYWGEVCRDDWDVQDATVVCRQVGYDIENGGVLVMDFGLGDNFRRTWLYEVECNGNETSLSQCPHEESGVCLRPSAGVFCPPAAGTDQPTEVSTTQATESTTAGIIPGNQCNTSGEVRLVGGVHPGVLEGRLEVCLNGEWGTVCNDGWDMNDARVVCRQLGIAEEELENIVTGLSFGGGPSNQQTHFENATCDGSESRLVDCDNLPGHDCFKPEDVGIICQRSEDCTDGEVRLVDGDVPTEGRVEFCRGGQWGTVCDNTVSGNSWDENDVAVVCKQLGHFTLEPRVLTPVPAVDNLNTPIMMYDVECIGREDGLTDCQIRTLVEYCSHSDDVGANCTREIECDDNDVRLVGGLVENEGIVEFCRNGYWGEVCRTDWDVQDATVVCRQVGYDVENGSALTMDFGLGDNFRRTWLLEVECNGDETSLSQCPHKESGTCIRPSAGVICPLAGTDLKTTTTESQDVTVSTEQVTDVDSTGATSSERSGPLPAVGILTVLIGATVYLYCFS